MATPEETRDIDPLADEHFIRPTEPDGIGPTLGQDVGPANVRREDDEAAAFRKSQQR